METNIKALLIGASGLTGGHCLRLLLEDKHYETVEIWVRKPLGITHPKLMEKIVDFNNLENISNTDARHVYCCLGTTIKKAGNQENFYKTDHDYVIAAANIAARSGAEKFLYISSIGANSNSRNFYLRTKGKAEEDLKKVFKDGLIIFRPSMLMGKRQECRFGEEAAKIFMRVFGFIFSGKLKKYRGIDAAKVAEAMMFCAKSEKSGIITIESDQILEILYNQQ